MCHVLNVTLEEVARSVKDLCRANSTHLPHLHIVVQELQRRLEQTLGKPSGQGGKMTLGARLYKLETQVITKPPRFQVITRPPGPR